MDIDKLSQALRRTGMRLTPQRLAICKLLSESKNHPTAGFLYDEVRQIYPSISLATIYNTLEALVEAGVINVLGHAGDDNVHYDANTEPHINLACVNCHKIIDIPSHSVNRLNEDVMNLSGYKILGARVMYYGVCPACQTRAVIH